MDSSLASSSSKTVAQLAKSFAQVKDKVLGDPAAIDRTPLPTPRPAQGCSVPEPSTDGETTVYGQMRLVQAQLTLLAGASEGCTGAIVTSLRRTVGTLDDECQDATALGALTCAGTALSVSSQDLVAAQAEFEQTFDADLLDDLGSSLDAVLRGLAVIRRAADGLDTGATRSGLEGIATSLDGLGAALADTGTMATRIEEVSTRASQQRQLLTGTRGAIAQAAELADVLCDDDIEASPEREEASVLLTGKTCAGTAAPVPGFDTSLQDKLGADLDAWTAVADATGASGSGLDRLRRDLRDEAASLSRTVARLLDGALDDLADDLAALTGAVDGLYAPRPQPPAADGTPQPDLPSPVQQLQDVFEQFEENQDEVGGSLSVFRDAAAKLLAGSREVDASRRDLDEARRDAETEAAGLLNPFAQELDRIGKGVVTRGKRTVTRQRAALDREAAAFRTDLDSTVDRSVQRIDAQVGAANRDLASSERQLLADLKAVLVNIGQPRQDGSGLLGAIFTGARRTGASNLKIAGTGDATEAFSQVRATALDDLYLQQAQVAASLEAEAAFPAFDLEVPAGASHRTVFSFHVGQD